MESPAPPITGVTTPLKSALFLTIVMSALLISFITIYFIKKRKEENL